MEIKKLNRLKVVMAEKDLSSTWLSEKLGVSQATVSKWMTNFSQPNLVTLIKISKVLDVDVNELIRPDEVQIDEEV
jgi:DNA-binding Xre family transcriptional regulator